MLCATPPADIDRCECLILERLILPPLIGAHKACGSPLHRLAGADREYRVQLGHFCTSAVGSMACCPRSLTQHNRVSQIVLIEAYPKNIIVERRCITTISTSSRCLAPFGVGSCIMRRVFPECMRQCSCAGFLHRLPSHAPQEQCLTPPHSPQHAPYHPVFPQIDNAD
jgi:hypothetical protein